MEVDQPENGDHILNQDNLPNNVIENHMDESDDNLTPPADGKSPTASSESLSQLSRQINGLLSQSNAYLNGEGDAIDSSNLNDLEARNQDLAALLEKQNQANEQLQVQVNEMKNHNSMLQQQLNGERKGFEDKLKRELGALKEQLQVHIQTIGILVAEKTELQSSLNQSKKTAEQRLEELEELSGRLKASRQRVGELERDTSSLSTSSQRSESACKEFSKEVDRLKLELFKLNKSGEEFRQQNSELQEKLQTKITECGYLEQTVAELQTKLEMTEVYVQQLSNQENQSDNSQQLLQLQEERAILKAKLDQYSESFQQLTAERDQLVGQYRSHVEQLNQQIETLNSQIHSLTEEKDQLIERQEELQALTTDLQNRLEEAGQSSASFAEVDKARQEVVAELEKLRHEFQGLSERYQAQVRDNSQLSMLIEEKENHIGELENAMTRIKDEAVDRESVLENMQSDKTALSRAMAQNKQLKDQLAELQNGFVRMSNDNMEMMSGLSSEQHVSKELAARLSQQEDELKEIREQLSQKDQQLRTLQASSQNAEKQMQYNEQLADQLRHYETQAQLVETLQKDLVSAQDTINALYAQNTELRNRVLQTEERLRGSSPTQEDDVKKNDMVDSLSASIRQLEMERNQLLAQYEAAQMQQLALQKELEDMQKANQTPAMLNGDVITKAQFDTLEKAMHQLEEKYNRTMREKAELQDKSEQMEHVVMQLQGETDTIGDYISIYQHQRAILAERQQEKDGYIQRLSLEREQMQDKLAQLQQLVMQLLGERQMLHAYPHSAAQAMSAMNSNIQPHLAASPASRLTTQETSPLEDWPDYSSSDSDSEVEAIVAGPDGVAASAPSTQQTKTPHPEPHQSAAASSQPHIPADDVTAQKIMHLLTEIGHSNMVDYPTFEERNFLPCKCCTGKLQIV